MKYRVTEGKTTSRLLFQIFLNSETKNMLFTIMWHVMALLTMMHFFNAQGIFIDLIGIFDSTVNAGSFPNKKYKNSKHFTQKILQDGRFGNRNKILYGHFLKACYIHLCLQLDIIFSDVCFSYYVYSSIFIHIDEIPQ